MNGILNREINTIAGKKGAEVGKKSASQLSFVYPFGSTLNVIKPAIPLLSSGSVSYPLNRPVAGIYYSNHTKGRILVAGSAQMFSDGYIDKEENDKLLDDFLTLLTAEKITLNAIDSNEPDVSDYHYVPDTIQISQNLKCCLQEYEDLPKDFTSLFDTKLFTYDYSHVPTAMELYEKLKLKQENLTLIHPHVIYLYNCTHHSV